MPKYFVDEIKGQAFRLEGDVAHHLKRVLRVRPGEKIILCNGKAMDFYCIIEDTEPLTLVVENYKESKTELPYKITLYQAMPKSDKLEWIIQKSVELGVHSIVPVYTEHSVVRYKSQSQNKNGGNTKTARYQKIAEAAAGQSMRGIIPKVYLPMPWEEAFEMAMAYKAAGGLIIAAHEKEQKQTIKSVLNTGGNPHFINTTASNSIALNNSISLDTISSNITISSKGFNEIGLWIGPEGGFSEKEIEVMEKSGFKLVSLGPRILRAETAAIAALAQITLMIENGV